jgi:hypothetical protein
MDSPSPEKTWFIISFNFLPKEQSIQTPFSQQPLSAQLSALWIPFGKFLDECKDPICT